MNHLRGYLSRAFTMARRMEKFPRPNPVADVPKRKVVKRLPDYLRPHEVQPLIASLKPKWKPLFATALYTGMRKGELFALRKGDVDFDAGVIMVSRSHDRDIPKGGRVEAVPINERAGAVPQEGDRRPRRRSWCSRTTTGRCCRSTRRSSTCSGGRCAGRGWSRATSTSAGARGAATRRRRPTRTRATARSATSGSSRSARSARSASTTCAIMPTSRLCRSTRVGTRSEVWLTSGRAFRPASRCRHNPVGVLRLGRGARRRRTDARSSGEKADRQATRHFEGTDGVRWVPDRGEGLEQGFEGLVLVHHKALPHRASTLSAGIRSDGPAAVTHYGVPHATRGGGQHGDAPDDGVRTAIVFAVSLPPRLDGGGPLNLGAHSS